MLSPLFYPNIDIISSYQYVENNVYTRDYMGVPPIDITIYKLPHI